MKDLSGLLKSFKENHERESHMELLATAFFENLELDNVEFGGWGLDSKRPFGNSMVEPDLAQIIGWERESIWENSDNGDYDEDKVRYLRDLYCDLGVYLKYKWSTIKG